MSICKYCGQEQPSKSMGAHALNCKFNPKYQHYQVKRKFTRDNHKILYKDFLVKCESCEEEFVISEPELKFPLKRKYFCSQSCANTRSHSPQSKAKISAGVVKTYLNKNSSYNKLVKKCPFCGSMHSLKRKFCSNECLKNNGVSEETRMKISTAVKGKTGGWRNFGGNGKKGIYKNIVYQSSWELAWLVYQFDHGENPTRSNLKISYINETGSNSFYYPDFELNGEIFEIKGFWSKKTELKLNAAKAININIILLTHKEMQIYLDYCKYKYGTQFYNAFLV